MKMHRLFVLMLLAMFVLTVPALADDTEGFIKISSELVVEQAQRLNTLDNDDDDDNDDELEWEEDHSSYGQQLEGTYAGEVYEAMEETLLENEPVLAEMMFGDEAVPVWEAGKFSKSWDEPISVDEFNEFLLGFAYEMKRAVIAFVDDNPELFWLHTRYAYNYSYWYNGQGNITKVELNIFMFALPEWDSTEEIAGIDSINARLNDVVETLLTATEDMPAVARLAYWDNWLAEHNSYNNEAVKGNYYEEHTAPWTAASALLDDYSPVCEGYAKALKMLCDRAGIPCVLITGTANGGAHMWTEVQIGEEWYFCDPTWDDPTYTNTGASAGESSRLYFLTKQPDSHLKSLELATPDASEAGFFENAGSWSMKNGSVSGCETGSDSYMVALYDENGRMLGMAYCYTLELLGETYYVAPGFDPEILSLAHSASRLAFNASWYVIGEDIKF